MRELPRSEQKGSTNPQRVLPRSLPTPDLVLRTLSAGTACHFRGLGVTPGERCPLLQPGFEQGMSWGCSSHRHSPASSPQHPFQARSEGRPSLVLPTGWNDWNSVSEKKKYMYVYIIYILI